MFISSLAMLALLPSANALVRKDGVGRLPALGWNSWNAFGCDVNEDKIMTAANEMVKLGLKDLGYEYVNIDDCWSMKTGRNSMTGRLMPNMTSFPDGISGVADQVHGLGLKIGIYSSAGETTCAGYPASLGHESLDAETWAGWGIDYLKYDNCGVPSNWTDQYNFCVPDGSGNFPNGTCPNLSNPAPAGYDWTSSNTFKRYTAMRNALLGEKRTILYSLCDWGDGDVNTWGNETGNSWRMSGDISASWSRIAAITNENSFKMNYVGFWGHPDPDMLEVGNGDVTDAEARSHFALWAAMKGPLIIGTDLDTLSQANLATIKNEYLIKFNQDPVVGRSAHPYKWGYNPDWTFDPVHPAEYWSGPSSNLGGTLVLMLNSENSTATRTAIWEEIPELKGGSSYHVTDAWSGKDLGCVKSQYSSTLASHDSAVLVVKGCC
ncbi:uncharacterized protein N7498_010824 [Penicillium cinerascens]|uniref:Alpha-galactosidase n=1 Tax=Penicillium cinerascens TaxID=70096 RepID=A0A9W9J8P4_9EURO|nr:uncharacterized protein N7498_010824 [Penicillium cinerascens]KAJ5191839.1 hypothetical protein N7498_010824 [Penicillium cinerascens]